AGCGGLFGSGGVRLVAADRGVPPRAADPGPRARSAPAAAGSPGRFASAVRSALDRSVLHPYAASSMARPTPVTTFEATLRFIRASCNQVPDKNTCTRCARHRSQRRLGFRVQFTLVAREAGDSAEARRAFVWLVLGEELLVDRLRHLEHSARHGFSRIGLAGEIAARMARAARRAERQGNALHLRFEFRNRQPGQ